jgi:hypothetical protein
MDVATMEGALFPAQGTLESGLQHLEVSVPNSEAWQNGQPSHERDASRMAGEVHAIPASLPSAHVWKRTTHEYVLTHVLTHTLPLLFLV